VPNFGILVLFTTALGSSRLIQPTEVSGFPESWREVPGPGRANCSVCVLSRELTGSTRHSAPNESRLWGQVPAAWVPPPFWDPAAGTRGSYCLGKENANSGEVLLFFFFSLGRGMKGLGPLPSPCCASAWLEAPGRGKSSCLPLRSWTWTATRESSIAVCTL